MFYEKRTRTGHAGQAVDTLSFASLSDNLNLYIRLDNQVDKQVDTFPKIDLWRNFFSGQPIK